MPRKVQYLHLRKLLLRIVSADRRE
ncbi:RepA leader peptide Tap [Rahnella victoriana]